MSRTLPRKPFALAVLAALGTVAVLTATAAHAQLGFGYQLPKDDFVWNWGRSEEGINRSFEDFNVHGNEGGFQCELTGKVGLSGRMSDADVRALEEALRTRLDFIYAVSNYMNELDRQNLIEWARLDCDKFDPQPSTEDEKAEREAKAKEKMQREIERRRAREHE
jgi:hypothetical protein